MGCAQSVHVRPRPDVLTVRASIYRKRVFVKYSLHSRRHTHFHHNARRSFTFCFHCLIYSTYKSQTLNPASSTLHLCDSVGNNNAHVSQPRILFTCPAHATATVQVVLLLLLPMWCYVGPTEHGTTQRVEASPAHFCLCTRTRARVLCQTSL